MPQRDLNAYLSDIRACIAAIESNIGGLTLEGYRADRKVRSAVEREFSIIGEALRQMLELDPTLESRIVATRQIISFRNHLVHGYFLIADATVWDIAQGHLPRLKQDIEEIARAGRAGLRP